MNTLLTWVTDLGDSAVIGAVALVTALQLAWWGNRRAAWTLLIALFAAAAGIGILKVAFIGCGVELFSLNVRSPSGHVAMSAAVFGVLAAIFARSLGGWARIVAPLTAILLVCAIAVTRVALGMHSIDEVLVGMAVGGVVGMASYGLLRPAAATPIRVARLLALVAVTAILMDGVSLPAEQFVRTLAAILQRSVPFCMTNADGASPTPTESGLG